VEGPQEQIRRRAEAIKVSWRQLLANVDGCPPACNSKSFFEDVPARRRS
jgi:hypothetical protein